MNTRLPAIVISMLFLSGCPRPPSAFDVGPDLVPERQPGFEGSQGFCIRDGQGNLDVRVRNQGNEPAFVETVTRVEFGPGQVETADTPPLADGSMAIVSVPIPGGCFNPDCGFTITVDYGNRVEELRHDAGDTSHEDNNTEPGICIG